MERLDRPKLSLLGFILLAVMSFIFMDNYDYTIIILFATTAIMVFFIKLLFKESIHEIEEDLQGPT